MYLKLMLCCCLIIDIFYVSTCFIVRHVDSISVVLCIYLIHACACGEVQYNNVHSYAFNNYGRCALINCLWSLPQHDQNYME